MKKFVLLIVTVALIAVLSGCNDAARARMSRGGPKVISLYSGGKMVKQWHSRNRVVSEDNSDGWYWVGNDGKLVMISGGAVTVEEDTSEGK
jgi:hypothetical protein